MTVTIGVDPGLSGAIACLVDGELLDVLDMPVIGKHVNAPEVHRIVAEFAVANLETPRVWLEDVHSMPRQGVASSFGFGRSKGVVEGVIAANGWPITLVTPGKWKKAMGLNADKNAARRLATNTWPQFSQWFARVKDDGRAEAALIALYGWRCGE